MRIQVFCSILLIFGFAITVSGDNAQKSPLEEHILALLNKWHKGRLHTRLFSLPSLKSISINKIQSYYEGKGIRIVFAIGDMKLTGLDNFFVNTLDVIQTQDILNVSATLMVPTLTLHADTYELTGRAYYIYPLKGFGSMTFILQNNLVLINIHFINVDNTYTIIKDFSLQYSVGRVEANLENSSWPITKILNNEGVKIFESYHKNINEAAKDYVVPYANKYLSQVTLKDFSNIIADISLSSYMNEKL